MEAKQKRNIKSGSEYDHLFTSVDNDDKTIRRNANVYHTVAFISKVVGETLDQTKKISKVLKGKSLNETCSNIWHFVYKHINYKKDREGYEQVRSPARAWHDRREGVDCDCYSVFISSILTNLGIPNILRITKYHRDHFQHIYPVVPYGKKYITIDCVTDKFDYEVPFSEKKDYPMDLQYLNGFDGFGTDELGKLIKLNLAKNKKPLPVKTTIKSVVPKPAPKAGLIKNLITKVAAKAVPAPAKSSLPASTAATAPPSKPKKKGFFKKVLNVVNKVNPATVLLRNGVLAAMKLNIKNVAKRLRWSYLTPQQAVAKNIDPTKFQKLVATREKLEKIFYGAGGKPENLKKAILGGKGNKDKAVSGLGMLSMTDWPGYMNAYRPLDQLLGAEIYYSENIEGMDGFSGFGELGEPITLATVGAAMGVIAGIVAALKQIGDVFKSKTKESEDFDESQTDAPENNVNIPASNSSVKIPSATANPIVPGNSIVPASPNTYSELRNEIVQAATTPSPVVMKDEAWTTDANIGINTSITPAQNSDTNIAAGDNGDKQNFWDKNKKWLKPVVIGAGGLTVIAVGYKIFKGSKTQNKSSLSGHSLSGIKHAKKKRKKKRHHHRRKRKHPHKKAVALL